MLRPEHLVTLREVLRLGSFAQAANRLGYTSSAISQQMAALEREVGVTLFHRSARSIVPTEAAHTLARHSSVVLTEIDRLIAAAEQATRTPLPRSSGSGFSQFRDVGPAAASASANPGSTRRPAFRRGRTDSSSAGAIGCAGRSGSGDRLPGGAGRPVLAGLTAKALARRGPVRHRLSCPMADSVGLAIPWSSSSICPGSCMFRAPGTQR